MPRLAIEKRFRRDLRKKPADLQGAILGAVQRLGKDPHHPSLRTKSIRGTKNPRVFEASIDMKNRMTWHWKDGVIVLLNHCNHNILKRNP